MIILTIIKNNEYDFFQAARRQMQAEAAERRRLEIENRGIKDPAKVKRQQQRAEQMERDELEAAKQGNTPALRVT